jgi:hypothetical protein
MNIKSLSESKIKATECLLIVLRVHSGCMNSVSIHIYIWIHSLLIIYMTYMLIGIMLMILPIVITHGLIVQTVS